MFSVLQALQSNTKQSEKGKGRERNSRLLALWLSNPSSHLFWAFISQALSMEARQVKAGLIKVAFKHMSPNWSPLLKLPTLWHEPLCTSFNPTDFTQSFSWMAGKKKKSLCLLTVRSTSSPPQWAALRQEHRAGSFKMVHCAGLTLRESLTGLWCALNNDYFNFCL